MNRDCELNPHFCHFNQVVVPYCDGTSFTGNLDEPVESEDKLGMPVKLYFRGRRILDAVLDELIKSHGLNEAEEVIITGYSAGGLTSLLFADYIQDRLQVASPSLSKFGVVPLSAFFLHHVWFNGRDGGQFLQDSVVFHNELLDMLDLANSSGSLPSRCVKAMGKNASQCAFAQNAYKFAKAPTFIVNSGVDLFQIAFIITQTSPPQLIEESETFEDFDDEIAERTRCVTNEECGADQMRELLNFQGLFELILRNNAPKVGSGSFIHSCPLHTEALSPAWSDIDVDGITMQQAVLKWWLSDGKSPTSSHMTLDCHVRQSRPHACNPACAKVHQGVG